MTATATHTPSYHITQRLAGYAVNDGRFIAERVRASYWDSCGILRFLGVSKFLGVFDTREQAKAAVEADKAEVATA